MGNEICMLWIEGIKGANLILLITKNHRTMNSIKQWYLSAYNEDKELGNQISESATFEGLELNIPNVYDYINVIDSIVRERVFSELAERIGATYDHVYNQWLEL